MVETVAIAGASASARSLNLAGHAEGGLAKPWLLADIGGTNARFAWVQGGFIDHIVALRCADYAHPAAAALAYLAGVAQSLGAAYRAPCAGALAVATSVAADQIEFTNSHWAFSRQALRAALELDELLVLNDFEALALALPTLGPAQSRPWSERHAPAAPTARAALAVIGPGTGLGVAGLVPTRHGWVAVPGEGGHATLAPADEFESALLAAARRLHAHVSAERLLSGVGLPTLHQAVAAVLGQSAEALAAEAIVERGLGGGDALCSRSLDAFCALLGNFAGSVALTMGARGGVYIGGGIVPRLGERFFASQFRERFEAKGRFRDYLQAIPTALITDTLAALGGAAQALAQHPC
jgi:glucokinase